VLRTPVLLSEALLAHDVLYPQTSQAELRRTLNWRWGQMWPKEVLGRSWSHTVGRMRLKERDHRGEPEAQDRAASLAAAIIEERQKLGVRRRERRASRAVLSPAARASLSLSSLELSDTKVYEP